MKNEFDVCAYNTHMTTKNKLGRYMVALHIAEAFGGLIVVEAAFTIERLEGNRKDIIECIRRGPITSANFRLEQRPSE